MDTREAVLALGLSALAIGCAEQSSDTQETVDNLVQAGFAADDILVVDGVVYVGNDAVVSLAASREMLQTGGGKEQYRTANLVAKDVTNICVNGAALPGGFSAALNTAIAHYNQLGLSFHLTRTAGSTAGCSAVITARTAAGSGTTSGFPSGGRPFNSITIGSDLIRLPGTTMGWILEHEIGHTIGLRHADFFDRSISCGGEPVNEGDQGVGAILVQGTPSGAQVGGSVMNSCFRTTEEDRFTPTDVTTLQALY
jgi:hypothetical protein